MYFRPPIEMYFRPPIENWTMIEIDRRRSKIDCIEWCQKKFDGRSDTATWLYYGDCKFEFKHEEDAVLFALRWV